MAKNNNENNPINSAATTAANIGKVLKSIFNFKLILIIVAVAILVITILAASLKDIIRVGAAENNNDPNSDNYRQYGPGAYSESITISTDDSESGTTSTDDAATGVISIGMSPQDMWDNDERYREYLNSVDDLKYLLNAQFVTQYPYIDSAGEDELNGTIRFYRNDSTTAMSYVSTDTLNGYIETYNNSGDTNARDSALNSFTLNADGSIMIAYLVEESYEVVTNDEGTADDAIEQISGSSKSQNEEGNYVVGASSSTLQTKNISYLSYVQNYTLPFNLLWSIVVMGHSNKSEAITLARSIADMAYEGEISLIIDDNNIYRVNTDTYTYNLTDHYNGTITANISGTLTTTTTTTDSEGNTTTNTEVSDMSEMSPSQTIDNYEVDKECNTVYTETHNENSPSIKIRKIVAWCAIFENDAKYETTSTSNEDSPNSGTMDDSEEEYIKDLSIDDAVAVPIPDLEIWKDMMELFFADETVTETNPDDGSTTEKTEDYTISYEGTITQTQNYTDITVSSTTSSSSTGYTNGTVTSPVFNDAITEKFNTSEVVHVRDTICDTDDEGWFIPALEVNEDTANLIDLIKYIINKANGEDVSDEDFNSIWNSISQDSSFNSVTSTSSMDFIQQYIRSWEGCTEISSDGTKYRIEDDTYGNLAVGHGIDIKNGGFTDRFTAAGYSTAEGAWVDVEFVDALELEVLQAAYNAVTSETADLNLPGYQIAALVSRYYNLGSFGWKRDRNGKTFLQAYEAYWSDSKTEEYFGQSNNSSIYSEPFYTNYMSTGTTSNGEFSQGLQDRREDEWLLFTTGYSARANLQWTDSMEGGDIVSVATRIHNYIRENQYAYSCYENVRDGYVNTCTCDGTSNFAKPLNASTIQEWYNMRCIDCSAFVSWVLYESGIDIGRQTSHFFYNEQYTSYTQYNWQKITNWNDLQPGDILVKSGHVGIYIGDGYTLEAGSTNAIRAEKSYGNISSVQNEYSFAVRVTK